jgi:hypothetical protein
MPHPKGRASNPIFFWRDARETRNMDNRQRPLLHPYSPKALRLAKLGEILRNGAQRPDTL